MIARRNRVYVLGYVLLIVGLLALGLALRGPLQVMPAGKAQLIDPPHPKGPQDHLDEQRPRSR